LRLSNKRAFGAWLAHLINPFAPLLDKLAGMRGRARGQATEPTSCEHVQAYTRIQSGSPILLRTHDKKHENVGCRATPTSYAGVVGCADGNKAPSQPAVLKDPETKRIIDGLSNQYKWAERSLLEVRSTYVL
jgi:hypothetical protein